MNFKNQFATSTQNTQSLFEFYIKEDSDSIFRNREILNHETLLSFYRNRGVSQNSLSTTANNINTMITEVSGLLKSLFGSFTKTFGTSFSRVYSIIHKVLTTWLLVSSASTAAEALALMAFSFSDYTTRLFEFDSNFLVANGPILQSQNFSSRDFLRCALNSSVALRFFNIVRDAVALEIVPKDLRPHVTKFVGRTPNWRHAEVSYLNFTYEIIDASIELCHSLQEYINGGIDFYEIFSNEKDRFIYKSYKVIQDRDFYKLSSDSRKHRQTLQEAYSDIKKVWETWGSLSSVDKTNLIVSRNYSTLKRMMDEYEERLRTMHRQVPVGVVLHGNPGIGKSSILIALQKIFCEYANIEHSSRLVYSRDVNNEWWSNYDPAEQPIIHFPEVGAEAKHIVKHKGDSALKQLLLVLNDTPFIAPQAEAQKKGKDMVTPELVLIDTNDEDLNAPETMNNSAAIMRRFIFIKVKVKPEFSDKTGSALDPTKIDPSNPMDLWDFKIYRKVPTSNKTYSVQQIHEESTVGIAGLRYYFLQILSDSKDRHKAFKKATSLPSTSYGDYTPPGTVYESQSFDYGTYDPTREYDPTSDPGPNATEVEHFDLLGNSYLFFDWVCMLSGYCLWGSIFIFSLCLPKGTFRDFLQGYIPVMLASSFMTLEAKIWAMGKYWMSYKYRTFTEKYSPGSRFYIALGCIAACFLGVKIATRGVELCNSVSESGEGISEDKIEERLRKYEADVGAESGISRPKDPRTKDWLYEDCYKSHTRMENRCYNKPEEVSRTVKSNIRCAICYKGDTPVTAFILFGITGNAALMNTHIFNNDWDNLRVSNTSTGNNTSGHLTLPRSKISSHKVRDDLVVVILRGCLFKNVLNLFPSHRDSLTGAIVEHFPSRVKMTYSQIRMETSSGIVLGDSFSMKFPSERGDCGLPRIGIVNNACVIVCIHAAASHGRAVGVPVGKSELERALDDLPVTFLSEGNIPLPDGVSLSHVPKRSSINYEDVSSFKVYGGVIGKHRSKVQSRLIKSPFLENIEEFCGSSPRDEDGVLKFGIPLMKARRTKEDEYLAPYNNWLRKVNHSKGQLKDNVLRQVENVILHRILSIPVSGLSPLKIFSAINGVDGNPYIRSMSKSTSAGLNWAGAKKDYLTEFEGRFYPKNILQDSVADIYDTYLQGELSHRVLGAQLKDEALPMAKVLKGKTRVFFNTPIDAVIFQRQYLAPFYSLMVEFRDVFCCKLGIDMHSDEVGDMYEVLSDKDYRVFEGDYSGYDVSFPLDIGYSANKIVEKFLEQKGYNSKALHLTRCVLEENLMPTVEFDGTVMVMPGIQPSGKYGTAEDNSLRGLILLLYAWHEMMCDENSESYINTQDPKTLGDFFIFIRPYIYGDDVIAAVHTSVIDFNAASYAQFCTNIYGCKFTAVSKDGSDIQDFVSLEDMSFLKRNFRYHGVLKRFVAPLQVPSLVKMLTYYQPSKFIDKRTLLASILKSFLDELYFHVDSIEDFNKVRFRVLTHFKSHFLHVEDIDTFLPDGDTITSRLLDNAAAESQFLGGIVKVARRMPKMIRNGKKAVSKMRSTKGNIFKKAGAALKDTGVGRTVSKTVKTAQKVVKPAQKRSLPTSHPAIRAKAHLGSSSASIARAAILKKNIIPSKKKMYGGNTSANGRKLGTTGYRMVESQSEVNHVVIDEGGQEVTAQEFTEGDENLVGEISHSPGYVIPSDHNIENILSQYVYCGSFSHGRQLHVMNPYVMWAMNEVISSYLFRFSSFRANLEISISWNAEPQSVGYMNMATYPLFKTNPFFNLVADGEIDPESDAFPLQMYISQNEYAAEAHLEKQTSINYLVPFVYEKAFAPLDVDPRRMVSGLVDISTLVVCTWGIDVPVDMDYEVRIRAVDLELGVKTNYQSQSADLNPTQTTDIEVEIPNAEDDIEDEDATGIEGTMQTFSEICGNPSLIAQRTWGGSKSQYLMSIPVSPQFGYVIPSTSLTMLSPCGHISQAFRLWRGTMCYHFSIKAPKIASGRILIRYSASPQRWDHGNPLQEMGKHQEKTIDLEKTREQTIRVGMSNREYYRCGIPIEVRQSMGSFPPNSAISDEHEWHERELCNGFIRVDTVGKIYGISGPMNAVVVVKAWMEDAEFFTPVPEIKETFILPGQMREALSQSLQGNFDGDEEEEILFRSVKPPLSGMPNYASVEYENIYTLTGQMQTKLIVSSGTHNRRGHLIFDRNLPLPLQDGDVAANKGSVTNYYTAIDHFRRVFACQRGAMRFMLSYPTSSMNAIVSSVTSFDPLNTGQYVAWYDNVQHGSNIYSINLNTGPYEFRSHSMSGTFFEPTSVHRNSLSTYSNNVQKIVAQVPRVMNDSDFKVYLNHGTGDNFKYMFYIGVPPIIQEAIDFYPRLYHFPNLKFDKWSVEFNTVSTLPVTLDKGSSLKPIGTDRPRIPVKDALAAITAGSASFEVRPNPSPLPRSKVFRPVPKPIREPIVLKEEETEEEDPRPFSLLQLEAFPPADPTREFIWAGNGFRLMRYTSVTVSDETIREYKKFLNDIADTLTKKKKYASIPDGFWVLIRNYLITGKKGSTFATTYKSMNLKESAKKMITKNIVKYLKYRDEFVARLEGNIPQGLYVLF